MLIEVEESDDNDVVRLSDDEVRRRNCSHSSRPLCSETETRGDLAMVLVGCQMTKLS